MNDAPERIWAQDANPSECNYCGGGWWDDECGNTQCPHIVEYIRSDINAELVKAADELAEAMEWFMEHAEYHYGATCQIPQDAFTAYKQAKEKLK